MADTHDTIDGLLAEFRGYSAGMPPSYHVTMSWADFRRMLDRFDAAHRRERGDCAKLREALVKCREIALQWQADEAAGVAGTTDKPHARSAAEAVIDMEFEINAALTAPPRNCDRFATVDEAIGAYRQTHKYMVVNVFLDWLFAQATEKEGGAK